MAPRGQYAHLPLQHEKRQWDKNVRSARVSATYKSPHPRLGPSAETAETEPLPDRRDLGDSHRRRDSISEDDDALSTGSRYSIHDAGSTQHLEGQRRAVLLRLRELEAQGRITIDAGHLIERDT